jgi:hypothetical protein
MKHSTSKIKLMELAGLVKEVAVTDQKVANVRKAMEAAIALLNNPKEIERRINNIKFAVYNSLDPNTNGGERPKPGFKFDDAWWASAVTDDYALSLVGSEIKGALAGKSFGEPLIKEDVTTKNESVIGGVINDLLNKMATNTKLVADVLTIIKLAKEDKEGNAEKAVELMMKNHSIDRQTAIEAVTRIFKNAFEWVK